jgi:hypothetical protein
MVAAASWRVFGNRGDNPQFEAMKKGHVSNVDNGSGSRISFSLPGFSRENLPQ